MFKLFGFKFYTQDDLDKEVSHEVRKVLIDRYVSAEFILKYLNGEIRTYDGYKPFFQDYLKGEMETVKKHPKCPNVLK